MKTVMITSGFKLHTFKKDLLIAISKVKKEVKGLSGDNP